MTPVMMALMGTATGIVAVTGPTTWNSVNGVNKSQYLTITTPFFQAMCNADIGLPNGVRSTNGVTGQRRHEFTVDGNATAATPNFLMGVTDSSTTIGPSVTTYPGKDYPGAAFRLKVGSTGSDVFRNGVGVTGTALTTALAVGDKLAIEFDTSALTVALWHKPGASAAYKVQTLTLTSQIPSGNWHAYYGGHRNGDKATANFGAWGWLIAATAGYTGFDTLTAPTFNQTPDPAIVVDSTPSGGATWSITASQPVNWTWSKTGGAVTALQASGLSGTAQSFTVAQNVNCTVTLSCIVNGTTYTWVIGFTNAP